MDKSIVCQFVYDLSLKQGLIFVYRQRQYQGFPLNVQTQVQNSPESVPAEPSTEITFDDYPQMNAYDTYSSINDSSELRKLSLNLSYAYYYAIITA